MANNLEVTTPSDCEILMTRRFNAPRRLVWEAMTQPEWIRRWIYAPPGWTMTVCEVEAQVGGRFRWAWHAPDGQPAMTISGTHHEVAPLERISHTERMELGDGVLVGEMLATITLTELGEQTLLRMSLQFASREARDGALASGMEHGVAAGYERLDALFAQEQLASS